jgi:hypothetical protein
VPSGAPSENGGWNRLGVFGHIGVGQRQERRDERREAPRGHHDQPAEREPVARQKLQERAHVLILGSRRLCATSHDDVEHHVAGRDEDHAALHQQDVAPEDRVDQHPAHAGPLEHDLDIDRARQDEARLDAEDRG